MSENDIVVTSQAYVPDGTTISKKPMHYIFLESSKAESRAFISLDKPDMTHTNCIHAKGFYSNATFNEMRDGLIKITTAITKDQIEEVYINWDAIKVIKNLIFRAK